MSDRDQERNRLAGRVQRYARVGTGVGQAATRIAGARLFGAGDRGREAELLRAALGNLKGPIMKVAQLMATIPDALPPEYAAELQKLQSDAPPMGWAFVKRRMASELGADWASKYGSFEKEPAAAASLGQVHHATTRDGAPLAVKLQYPDMQSAVEADIRQLEILFAIHRRMDPAIDTREILTEIGARVREELDYDHEARHAALYRGIFAGDPTIRVPDVHGDLSTRRLLTMGWLEGRKILEFKGDSLEVRNRLARAMFRAWWYPFSHYGVIHGDPHLGNYTVWSEDGEPGGINLLDYGCIRIFTPRFVRGVLDLYEGLRDGRRDQVVAAYETWGFKNLKSDLIDVLNIWASFIYGPILDNRVRTVADGVAPGEYGRRPAFEVHRALKEKGPVTVPREFVFMDRAAIGLGSVFLHLEAEMNWYQLFSETIADFDKATLEQRQSRALRDVGLSLPEDLRAA
jgi:predicted unusual protein kinase regulating ubiquinone biosynthesis (AarF/ABC1/UbiB family)